LSSLHADELCNYRPGEALCPSGSKDGYLDGCKERLADKKMIPVYIKPGMARKMYVCFGCNTARNKDDVEHFKKHPNCLELHRKRAALFTSREGKSVDAGAADAEMKWRRVADKHRIHAEELGEELEEMKDLLFTFLGIKDDEQDEMTLETFKAALEEQKVIVKGQQKALEESKSTILALEQRLAEKEKAEAEAPPGLPFRESLPPAPPKVEVQTSIPPAPFGNEMKNFPSREVSAAIAPPPLEQKKPKIVMFARKVTKPSAPQTSFSTPPPPFVSTPLPPISSSSNNPYQGKSVEELGTLHHTIRSPEQSDMFMEAWNAAQARLRGVF